MRRSITQAAQDHFTRWSWSTWLKWVIDLWAMPQDDVLLPLSWKELKRFSFVQRYGHAFAFTSSDVRTLDTKSSVKFFVEFLLLFLHMGWKRPLFPYIRQKDWIYDIIAWWSLLGKPLVQFIIMMHQLLLVHWCALQQTWDVVFYSYRTCSDLHAFLSCMLCCFNFQYYGTLYLLLPTDQYDPEVCLGHLKWYTFKELRAATNNFNSKNILGEGGYGIVYKGFLHDGAVVAVKRLKDYNAVGGEVQFRTEVKVISLAVHRNLLWLIGFCTIENERLLVYPYMPNGSVASQLRGRSHFL